jgi:hypothetical protein
MLTAMDSPHLTIIGHPTGRLLLTGSVHRRRCRHRESGGDGVAPEINADPHRLTTGVCPRARDRGAAIRSAPTPTAPPASLTSSTAWHGPEGVARRRGYPERAAGRISPVARRRAGWRRFDGPKRRPVRAGRGCARPGSRDSPGSAPRIPTRCALDHRGLRALCATILSAQCTDVRGQLSRRPFKALSDPRRWRGRSRRTSNRSSGPPASSEHV